MSKPLEFEVRITSHIPEIARELTGILDECRVILPYAEHTRTGVVDRAARRPRDLDAFRWLQGADLVPREALQRIANHVKKILTLLGSPL